MTAQRKRRGGYQGSGSGSPRAPLSTGADVPSARRPRPPLPAPDYETRGAPLPKPKVPHEKQHRGGFGIGHWPAFLRRWWRPKP